MSRKRPWKTISLHRNLYMYITSIVLYMRDHHPECRVNMEGTLGEATKAITRESVVRENSRKFLPNRFWVGISQVRLYQAAQEHHQGIHQGVVHLLRVSMKVLLTLVRAILI